ncbi:hypothetical protein UFOVP1516_66 [uncultured Caudovirales phage]|uniref:Uncharacterized protein n=1 Tax=uncultured Caudovirales phage TaxID=2100421 RepID=A0A6J5PBK6_9CAUD|nr:hypothetical protein UFOVP887_69 [uncultured Caudovirales phage]CAB5226939.1 hypothetical protein UFOVP1516_66 [uncultured Caudovirales phage]
MENLISLLFLARDVAHREHLHTSSYAQHVALGSFYSDIIDNADAITEAYQGAYDKLPPIPIKAYTGSKGIVETLQSYLQWIKDNRYKVCSKEDTAIQNLIDEAVSTFQSTLYKLRFLS